LVLEQIGRLGGRSGEDAGIAGVRLTREGVQAFPSCRRLGRVVVEEDHEVAEDVQGFVGARPAARCIRCRPGRGPAGLRSSGGRA
jgi:hypothetical protein